MLDDLGSYRLSDFLLFSQETYFRQFELYNQAWWPVLILFLVAGGVALVLLTRGSSRRAPLALCSLSWAWIAWAFHLEQYATIQIAAPYFAVLFAVEAVVLAIVALPRQASEGVVGPRRTSSRLAGPWVGPLMLAYALFVHPFLGLAAGRTWTELAVFGMGPDPTTIGTLGVLLAVGGRWTGVALIPAVIWCLVSAATAYAMGSVEALPPAAAALLALGFAVRRPRSAGEAQVRKAEGA